MLNEIKLGVQSWCFRGLGGNEANIEALKAIGVSGIELCGVHVNIGDPQSAGKVVELYRENGFSVTSFGIDNYTNDEKDLINKLETAKAAGIRTLGADPDPDAFPLIDELCGRYGVKIAIHNHGRNHRYGSKKQLQEAFANSTPNIGLCLDTAWALDSGENPIDLINCFSDRLYGVHFKDFKFNEEFIPGETILGKGALDLKGVVKALNDMDFKGYATIEYEGTPENPIPSIIKCVEALKGYMGISA